MEQKLDKKFYASIMADENGDTVGTIRKAKNDEYVPDDEWCVFLAKDDGFFHAALPAYIRWCKDAGCDQEQIDAIEAMAARVAHWRAMNPRRIKKPDAAGERLLP